MKLFPVVTKGHIYKYLLILTVTIVVASCATHKPQYGFDTGPEAKNDSILQESELEHRFYLIGDAGYANEPHAQNLLGAVKKKIDNEDKNTSLMYMGDNIYPWGMPPDKDHKDRDDAEKSLDAQIEIAKLFKGKTYFIPGNHDWYHGLKGLEAENDYIEKKLKDNKSFLPGKGCGIDHIEVSDSIMMIVIDSQWYITDWDDYPTINDDCDIKTRDAMFTELADLLNDNQNKVIVLAIHHPVFTNGAHGGNFSMRKQFFPVSTNIPVPILGSFINLTRKASGYSTQDIQSRVYGEMAARVRALVEPLDNVVIVSGHDHNLQYINHDHIHQVVSGAGCKQEAARAVYPRDFSYGGTGYVVMDIFKDGKAKIDFFSVNGDTGEEAKLFERIIDLKPKVKVKEYPSEGFPPVVKAQVYPDALTDKTKTYKFLFGKHYREFYSKPIEVRVVNLDTLYGGLTPVKTGGGKQSNTLRLTDKDGKEYAMRSLRKNATKFIQKTAFQSYYLGDALDNTIIESLVLDFYTSAHPYAGFVVDNLAESINILHSNPKLFYVPKQAALQDYNQDYGNELYMIEEHAHKDQRGLKSFGDSEDIESTSDVFEDMRKNKKYVIDEDAYIRARLFDMLIGDWDRHADQWKWAKYTHNDSIVYKPIAKDHDQAFPKYGGALLSALLRIPAMRPMQNYDDEIKSVKWLNKTAYPLDVAMIRKANAEDWAREARYLKAHLTDEAIEKAFNDMPAEVRGKVTEEIKRRLKSRRDHIEEYALEYRKVLLKCVVVTGTDDKERFEITRLPEGKTEIKVISIKKDKEEELYTQTYSRSETKEIWIYGLDDDDEFIVKGKPDNPILLRLLGGQNHDKYTVENGRRVKIYDFASKENTYNVDRRTKLILTNHYETNTYDYKKPKYNFFASYPYGGFNPDDGVNVGASFHYTVNNFARIPYSQLHKVTAAAYFATAGYELKYRGEFITLKDRWNFACDIRYTSPTYSINYFGYGNTTPNYDDNLGMDYNRVKFQTFRIAPAIFRTSRNGSFAQLQPSFETIEVSNTPDRFVSEPGAVRPALFEHRQYGGVNAIYSFANYDNKALPALGMAFHFCAGWTGSFDDANKNFWYGEGMMNVVHKITADDKLVFDTTLKARLNFGNDFEFYQAPTLGGDSSLRGYRDERFTGKRAAFQSSDLRYSIGMWKNSFVPVTYGIFGGYDYGRVWISGGNSNKWHQSVGGGLFVAGLNTATAKVYYFHGSDGGRISFNLLFGF